MLKTKYTREALQRHPLSFVLECLARRLTHTGTNRALAMEYTAGKFVCTLGDFKASRQCQPTFVEGSKCWCEYFRCKRFSWNAINPEIGFLCQKCFRNYVLHIGNHRPQTNCEWMSQSSEKPVKIRHWPEVSPQFFIHNKETEFAQIFKFRFAKWNIATLIACHSCAQVSPGKEVAKQSQIHRVGSRKSTNQRQW